MIVKPASLETRIARLERTNRLLILMSTFLCAVVLLAVSMPKRAVVVRAERFELIDTHGQVHATLETSEHGETGLFIRDDDSQVRLSLAHDTRKTALAIRDGAGVVRLVAAQFGHVSGGFALHGEEQKGKAVLYLMGGQGSLRIFDGEGDVTYEAPTR